MIIRIIFSILLAFDQSTQPGQSSWNKVEIPISGDQKDPGSLIIPINPISLIVSSRNLLN